jgi:hypothetical protein
MNDFWIKTMKLPLTILLGLVLLALPIPPAPAQPVKTPVEKQESVTKPRHLTIANKPWQGDFDRMIGRRMIRVLVLYSRTLYFTDKGQERGITADTVRDFERYVNRHQVSGPVDDPLLLRRAFQRGQSAASCLCQLQGRPRQHRQDA